MHARCWLGSLLLMTMLTGTGCTTGPDVGTTLQPIAIDTWVNTPNGDAIDWQDLRGQPVLVEFWSRECPPCRKRLSDMKRFHEQHAADGLRVVTLHVDLSRPNDAATRQFIEQQHITYPVALGRKEDLDRVGVSHLPYAMVLDAQGIVQWSGNLVWENLLLWKSLDNGVRRQIEKHLAAKQAD